MIKDFLFKTKDGKYVIGQKPNFPLIIGVISWVLNKLFSNNDTTIFASISTLAFIIWALLEIIFGVNLFRRIVGIIVLIIILDIYSYIF